MWERVAHFVLRNRLLLLLILFVSTAFMAWQASKVELSYEFSRAIPTDNQKYLTYQAFRKEFGEDGNMLVIGFTSKTIFTEKTFNQFQKLNSSLKTIKGVEDVLSVTTSVNLVKNAATERLQAVPVFPGDGPLSQTVIDSGAALFRTLPFYRTILYNPATDSYLTAVRVNRDMINSKARTRLVGEIVAMADSFGTASGTEMHYSGLPLIRTQLAERVSKEMKWFLFGSLALSALILLVFFRSFSTMLLSLAVVIIGVIWSLGTMHLFGYSITLLNALIPPLIVVIGIPNCIYFLNKYHLAYNATGDKKSALIQMVSKMGIVTLFCNIAAAIGFAVFALTRSAILKEFGVVAGINIMVIFFISFILIPSVLSYLPAPKSRHTKYLDNPWLLAVLDKLEHWALNHRKWIYIGTIAVVAVSIVGITRLRSEGFIVDDLPKKDKIFRDLKYFESNFKGVMPLEIVIDTKQKNGMRKNPLLTFEKIDSFSQFIAAQPEMARPLSIVEGLKFARQAYYDGDSSNYGIPNSFDISFLSSYLNTRSDSSGKNTFTRLISSFMDSNKQKARISVNMADVGSKRLPELMDKLGVEATRHFDTSRYSVAFTGTSVTFLEGTSFIIRGLKDSVLYAFILITLCMLYLFKSLRILFCSLIPNIIPLVITAGVMGWAGVTLKPSTVLVFSVALGIAIDITIRFLVNYKQEQTGNEQEQKKLVIDTIHTTGISIIYTSLVLIVGFVIFCFSGFGGTQALGWLTSLTLIVATLTNLILLPALLISTIRSKK
ncbi:MAG: MMPL family transporter [Gemmatimonadaceae bacterium]|nr:MMPL family transporter [Chitinophagaceae bacterium]